VLNTLYNEKPKDVAGWNAKIKQNIVKYKVNPVDEAETNFIELDLVLSFYMDDYKKLR
jgi:hypothetical protein